MENGSDGSELRTSSLTAPENLKFGLDVVKVIHSEWIMPIELHWTGKDPYWEDTLYVLRAGPGKCTRECLAFKKFDSVMANCNCFTGAWVQHPSDVILGRSFVVHTIVRTFDHARLSGGIASYHCFHRTRENFGRVDSRLDCSIFILYAMVGCNTFDGASMIEDRSEAQFGFSNFDHFSGDETNTNGRALDGLVEVVGVIDDCAPGLDFVGGDSFQCPANTVYWTLAMARGAKVPGDLQAMLGGK